MGGQGLAPTPNPKISKDGGNVKLVLPDLSVLGGGCSLSTKAFSKQLPPSTMSMGRVVVFSVPATKTAGLILRGENPPKSITIRVFQPFQFVRIMMDFCGFSQGVSLEFT